MLPARASLGVWRLGGCDLPFELAHGLLHQFVGFLDVAIDSNAAQVRIGGLLQLGQRFARVGGWLGAGGPQWCQRLEARC